MTHPTSLVAVALLATAILAVALGVAAAEDTPAEELQHRWRLEDLYPDPEAWSEALNDLQGRLDRVAACEGTLGQGPAQLASCLDTYFDLVKELTRLGTYATTLSDSDTRAARPLEMRQQASMLGTNFRQASSYLVPEILSLGETRIDEMLAAEPALAPYRFFLQDTLRSAPHVLSEEGETVIATAGMMADTPYQAYSILTAADIPWPTVTLSDGTEARLDQAGYTRYRSVPDRADRKLVFDTFFSTWQEYQRTCGVTLYSQLKRDLFYSRVRDYPTTLATALDANNVPEPVYHTLIEAANANLDTLHRYLELRSRMLGIDELRYYDLYPPLVTSDEAYPVERGKALVLTALEPLGEDYVEVVGKGFSDRWMDVFPRPAKRSGAYSTGRAYDVHPYVLMNYVEDYESVSTLAHEWGHAMHSYLANQAQPFPTAGYSIFVAEVASTFNEALLLDQVLATTSSDDERLYYLGSALEGLRQTFFRQTMFAEFELAIHQRVEKGEALSGQRLTEIYAELVRRYHGHDQGVCRVDDLHTHEWAYIPHFYYNYYVYQYATSLAASSLFAQEVLDGVEGARERYLDVLRAGGSRYPYELLKDAGVDLATMAPYDALVQRMNSIMDEIEAILDRREQGAESPA